MFHKSFDNAYFKSFRVCFKADFDSVLAINNNVHEGNDYLPEIFNQWIEEPDRGNFVAISKNEVVGFFSLSRYLQADRSVFVEQALRNRV